MITNAQDASLTIDTTKLEEVMSLIETHPAHHHQGVFTIGNFAQNLAKGFDSMSPLSLKGMDGGDYGCGTAACFAGWAGSLYAEELGYQPASRDSNWFEKVGEAGTGEPMGLHVASLAVRALGLTDGQADTLFSGGNTRVMLRSMVKDLCNTGDLRPHCAYRDEDFDNYVSGADYDAYRNGHA